MRRIFQWNANHTRGGLHPPALQRIRASANPRRQRLAGGPPRRARCGSGAGKTGCALPRITSSRFAPVSRKLTPMNPNPFLGVFLHWLGGLASGSFYVPYRGVKKWAWETYWLAGGVFSWISAPWGLGLLMTRGLPAVLSWAPPLTLLLAFFFGLVWGVWGLTLGFAR